MSLSVCPIAVIRSPAEHVWALLAQPASYDTWWEVKTDAIVPPGPAQAGQHIRAHGRALGRDRSIEIRIIGVDHVRRQLELLSSFPFGISLHNDIRVSAVDAETTKVSF